MTYVQEFWPLCFIIINYIFLFHISAWIDFNITTLIYVYTRVPVRSPEQNVTKQYHIWYTIKDDLMSTTHDNRPKKIFFFVVYVKFYLFHSILFLHFIILWPTKMLFVPLKTLEPYTKWAHLMSLLYLNNCCWERNKVRQVDGRSRSSKIIFFIDIIYYTLRLLWFLPASACSFLCHNWMSASFNQSQVVGFSSYTKLIKRVCNGLCVCV